MFSELNIEDALKLNWPIIDVRSPDEYTKGHIPKAINIALFTNEERAHIGTIYKQKSKEEAIEMGYYYTEPKLEEYLIEALNSAPTKEIILHCWRGGMRSRAFAKHLTNNGFIVKVIIGGYKAYRKYILENLEKKIKLIVLGGYTGSGKTHILRELKKIGKQVIDLEALAVHKGSAFGGIGQAKQPSVEQFENNLYHELGKQNKTEPIWIEDESHSIGKVKIPIQFFKQMRNAKLYFIDIPKNKRALHLVTEYAGCNSKQLAESILHIKKRLGGLKVKNSIVYLEEENYYEVAKIVLDYYDKSYLRGMNNRDLSKVVNIPLPSTDHYKNALEIEKQIIK